MLVVARRLHRASASQESQLVAPCRSTQAASRIGCVSTLVGQKSSTRMLSSQVTDNVEEPMSTATVDPALPVKPSTDARNSESTDTKVQRHSACIHFVRKLDTAPLGEC